MTNQQHPITPPPELVEQLWNRVQVGGDFAQEFAARRPKPPSNKELALEALQSMQIDPELIETINGNTDLRAKYDTIRRGLEALPND